MTFHIIAIGCGLLGLKEFWEITKVIRNREKGLIHGDVRTTTQALKSGQGSAFFLALVLLFSGLMGIIRHLNGP